MSFSKSTPPETTEAPDTAQGRAATPPTIRRQPVPINQARPVMERVCDLATDFAHDLGHPGRYDWSLGRVYWEDDDSGTVDRLAYLVDGDLIVPDESLDFHEPLELALELKCSPADLDGVLVVEGVAQ